MSPPREEIIEEFNSALNWRFGSTLGRSVRVTCAPRSAAAAIPTRPVPEPSSRILRGFCFNWRGERSNEGLRSNRETREEAAGQSWKERP